jgi:hypothetical protein
MSIIDKTYFKADITLPKSEFDNIQEFIDKFEKDVLIDLLGYKYYKEVIKTGANLIEPFKSLVEGKEYEDTYNGKTILVKWNGLKNAEKVSLISYYVYCYCMRSLVSSTQSVGETKSKQANSTYANIFGKVLAAWTNFEKLYGSANNSKVTPSAYNYLLKHESDFPDWIFTELEGSMNSHDL